MSGRQQGVRGDSSARAWDGKAPGMGRSLGWDISMG